MTKCEKTLETTEREMIDRIVFIEYTNSGVISQDYIRPIAEKIVKDVMEDICESADTGMWNDDDVRLAVGRVLCRKLRVVI